MPRKRAPKSPAVPSVHKNAVSERMDRLSRERGKMSDLLEAEIIEGWII